MPEMTNKFHPKEARDLVAKWRDFQKTWNPKKFKWEAPAWLKNIHKLEEKMAKVLDLPYSRGHGISFMLKYLGQVMSFAGFVMAAGAHGFGILAFCFCGFVYSVVFFVLGEIKDEY